MNRLFSQFVRPHGRIGQFVGVFMSKENKEINKWTIEFLDVQDHDHILEIGFGSGKAMKYILKRRNAVMITGVDPSEVMVYQSLRKLNKHLINNQIQLIEGYSKDLPYLPQKVDKVLVVNNITFWEEPVETLRKIYIQMNAGGKVALTIGPHEKGATDETAELIGGQMAALLAYAGFSNIKFFIKPTKPNDTVCALGRR